MRTQSGNLLLGHHAVYRNKKKEKDLTGNRYKQSLEDDGVFGVVTLIYLAVGCQITCMRVPSAVLCQYQGVDQVTVY